MTSLGLGATKKLRDICKIIGGKPAPQDDSAFSKQGIPFVRMKDVGKYHQTNNLVNIEDSISPEWAQKNGYVPLRPGCILLPRSGSVALNHRAILGVDAVIVSHLCALEVIDNQVVYTPYLYWYLCGINFEKFTKKTTGLDAINFSDLGEVTIYLPSLDEQQRIAVMLDKADAILRKCKESLNISDDLLRSIFLEMFGDPVSNSMSWDEKPIGELSTVTTGNTPSREVLEYYGDFIEWIKSDNINTAGHYLTKSKEGLSETGAKVGRKVSAGSTLITCIAGSPSCIGNAALADRTVAFNQQINALTPKNDIEPQFLYCCILFSKKRIQAASTSGMKGMVSKGVLEQVRLICPPKPKREAFVRIFEKNISMQKALQLSQQESEKLFASLSSQSFPDITK